MKTVLTFALVFLLYDLVYGQSDLDITRNMDTVTVRKRTKQINGLNSLTLSSKQIEAVPKMLGIADPLKAIRFLPGFGNGGDANSGLLYRGLSSGSNGYFYNGVQVHNPSHLFGLFPLFNSNVVKEVNIYTNVVPGKYFGKLSGYIDIKSNWQIGDTTIIKAEVSLAHFGVGARIERDSVQMVEIFWRSTFMNKTLWPVLSKTTEDIKGLNYDLYDLNINAKKVFNKSEVKAFLYSGRDKAMFEIYEGDVKNGMDWGNVVSGVTHKVDLQQQLQLENNIGYSMYDARVAFDLFDDQLSLHKRQNNLNINATLSYRKANSSLETGFLYTMDYLTSELQNGNKEDVQNNINRYKNKQRLFKYFLNAKYTLSEKIEAEGAVNLSAVSNLQRTFFMYPALSLAYLANAKNTFFWGASMSYQPTHQIALTSINIPIDYVIHSDRSLSVSKIREVSGGYRFQGSIIEFSIDAYYRWLSGLKEFDGNIIALNESKDITSGIIDGKGVTYGMDFFTKVFVPRNYLTINYSYSRSFRSFDAIHSGRWYKYIYDRPHNLSIVNAYKVTRELSISASFMYNSGSAYTPTVGIHHFNNSILAEYGAKNSARMTAYHRLDLGVEYLLKQTKRSKHSLGFSIINVYNRSNPIYKYQSYDRGHLEKYGSIKMIQKDGAHLPILPALTYSIELR